MYERGVEDAAHDDLNAFYYQHYYYYRRGYDDARQQMRRLSQGQASPPQRFLLLGFLLLLLLGGTVAFFVQRNSDTFTQQASTPTNREPVAAGGISPVRPTPTQTPIPPPSPTPAGLYVGRTARVGNVGTAALLARREPGIQSPVEARFPENAQVQIVDGPVEIDNYTWWRVEGAEGRGWSAERSPEGISWLVPQ